MFLILLLDIGRSRATCPFEDFLPKISKNKLLWIGQIKVLMSKTLIANKNAQDISKINDIYEKAGESPEDKVNLKLCT